MDRFYYTWGDCQVSEWPESLSVELVSDHNWSDSGSVDAKLGIPDESLSSSVVDTLGELCSSSFASAHTISQDSSSFP